MSLLPLIRLVRAGMRACNREATCLLRDFGLAAARRIALRGLGAVLLLSSMAAHADVSVTLASSNPTPVAGGAAYSYTVTMTNTSIASAATNVVMTLPLPPGVLFQNLSLSETSPTVPPAGTDSFFFCTAPGVRENGLITCRASSFEQSSAMVTTTATVTIVVSIDGALASGIRTATARVTSGGIRTTDSEQINIQVSAPLSISQVAQPTAPVGGNIVYLIRVNNSGNTTALNATITDPLPPNTSFVSMFGTGVFHDGCFYDVGSNSVQCPTVDIPPGVSALTLVVDTASNIPPGPLGNTATITSAGTGSIVVGNAMGSTTIALSVADPPTGVSAVAGNAQAAVSFTAPENNGGAAITGYAVTCTPVAGPPVAAAGPASPINVVGLTNGTTYTCTVHAKNSEGNSVESEPSNPVTPTAGLAVGLTVTIAGSGTGFVESNPPGISCPADCTQSYGAGTGVELTAGATGTSVFTGWLGGGCTGTGACIVTMNAAKSVIATFAPQGTVPTLDIDASAPGSKYDALTDGLLGIRYLFGLSGSGLTVNAVGPTATRSNAQIAIYLDNIRPALDIDGNGIADALTDGLLIIRRLFGLSGTTLIQNAVGVGAIRTSPTDIQNYLQLLTPP